MKLSIRHKFPAYALPVCMAAFSVWAHAKNTLDCTVVDETNKPVAKQEFTLTSASGKETKKKTNDAGVAKFSGLDDGTYTLKGDVSGFVDAKSAPMEVSGNAEKPCSYTLVSATYANTKLQEVMQLVQQRKFADAEEQGKKLVAMMPGEATTHYVLSVAYAYEGKTEAAEEVKAAAQLSPDKFNDKVVPIQMQELNVEAEASKQKRDFPGAIKKYEQMQALSPGDSTVFYNIGVTEASAGNYDKALEAMDKVLALKPDDADAKKLRDTFQKKFDDQLNQKLK